MDPLTHGLVGAAAAQSGAEKDKLRPAAFTGALSSMMADLDYYIQIPSDPLFNIEIHRQFSHSLIFIPVGALFASVLLWWFFKKYLTFKELYIYSILGYATAGLLDAFTSYGTQLLWPFLDTRFAWNLISVIDPVVTIGLILFVGFALLKKQKKCVWFAGGWLTFFLLFGWVQHQRATSAAENLAENRGHTIEEMVVKPTIANQRVWRANYISNGTIYTDAIRTGLISGIDVYEGESAPRIIIEEEFSEFTGTVMYEDLLRFKYLSENFLIRHPEYPEVIGDARYAMLPTKLSPLWGVKTDTTQTDLHLPFLYFRDAGEEVRESFMDMLLGK
ncbi:metal-dependent hydrolase [Rhodohalobacter halophilus]|uniref:metal-dependent hydrolase n=1 Tax=Rhodohalobacter halophilus TaxID=1812810 RepID=UPI00083F5732|nr:metal-dependent hydrolase [Rhodohalobacter halophilus]